MKDLIKYEDFKKLDIRVGTVKEASRVEKSDKLLKLMVDLGEDSLRQIVSGITVQYTPESMVGRQIIVIVNLEPRTIMGLESQGMLMAAGENETPILLQPDRTVINGSVVS